MAKEVLGRNFFTWKRVEFAAAKKASRLAMVRAAL